MSFCMIRELQEVDVHPLSNSTFGSDGQFSPTTDPVVSLQCSRELPTELSLGEESSCHVYTIGGNSAPQSRAPQKKQENVDMNQAYLNFTVGGIGTICETMSDAFWDCWQIFEVGIGRTAELPSSKMKTPSMHIAESGASSCENRNSPGSPAPIGESDMEANVPMNISFQEDLVFDHPKVPIGQGAFGIVYKAAYEGTPVAVKVIKSGQCKPTADELQVLARIGNHKNVVRCFGGCMTPPHIFVVEELMETDLHHLIHPDGAGLTVDLKPRPMRLRQTIKFALDIARGLRFMHQKFVHRDLKPQNVLIKDGVAKVADFGLSRAKTQAYISSASGRHGTVQYMAPESMMGKIDAKSDIYSLAMILWECVTGMAPFLNIGTIYAIIYQVTTKNLRPNFPLDVVCPPELRELIVHCWASEPRERPSCEEVIARLEYISNHMFGTSYGTV